MNSNNMNSNNMNSNNMNSNNMNSNNMNSNNMNNKSNDSNTINSNSKLNIITKCKYNNKDIISEEMEKYKYNLKKNKIKSNSIPPRNPKEKSKLHKNYKKHKKNSNSNSSSRSSSKLNDNIFLPKIKHKKGEEHKLDKKDHNTVDINKKKTTTTTTTINSNNNNASNNASNNYNNNNNNNNNNNDSNSNSNNDNNNNSDKYINKNIINNEEKEGSSDSVSNSEKKEISYFKWLAKEKKKKQEEEAKEKDSNRGETGKEGKKKENQINDVLNDEDNHIMLQPLSAFNLKQNEKKYVQDDFVVDKHPIGNGRTGLVFKAIIKRENKKVALKVMSKDTIVTLNIERQVLKEIIIQASLNHINILELVACFEDRTRLFLILELANGGSIRTKMKIKAQPLKEEQVALYVYQIADALSYLHSFNIIHRDLKPDNILIHYSNDSILHNKIYKYGVIKLADFGFSCQLKNKRQKRSTFCGTVDYMPPEIINQIPYDCNVDLWCLGIVIFELLVGFPPFTDDTQERIFDQIKELNFHFPKTVSIQAQELILKVNIK
uniref:non-specific serine/threonine protein kinase n=1 Tax=Piliocolobus tephrosceles TaxID=591936 RepID=A0A8C9GQ09_9PRIM